MRRVVYFEGQLTTVLQLFLRVLVNHRRVVGTTYLEEGRVVEKHCRRTIRNGRLEKSDYVVWRPPKESFLQTAVFARLFFDLSECLRLINHQLIKLVIKHREVSGRDSRVLHPMHLDVLAALLAAFFNRLNGLPLFNLRERRRLVLNGTGSGYFGRVILSNSLPGVLLLLLEPIVLITALAVDEQVSVGRADGSNDRLRAGSYADLALFGARGTLTQADGRRATLGFETEGLVIG